MIVVPAVDIKDGKCVRLVKGDLRQQTVYSDDPVEMARKWAEQGAERLHLVDLDAAFGTGSNREVIRRVRRSVPCKIQVGGGVRTPETLKDILDLGVHRVILGTAIFKNADWVRAAIEEYPGRITAGVDAKNREVKVSGWKEGSGQLIKPVLAMIEEMGFREVIFTDIGRDGTLTGFNMETLREVLSVTKMDVFYSGGISQVQDIRGLKAQGVAGVIVGKALYDGRMTFAQALAAAK